MRYEKNITGIDEAPDRSTPVADQLLDANLRRIYSKMLDQSLPERFVEVLQKLR